MKSLVFLNKRFMKFIHINGGTFILLNILEMNYRANKGEVKGLIIMHVEKINFAH